MPVRADLVPIRQLSLTVPDLCYAVCTNSGDGIGPTKLSDLLEKKLNFIMLFD